MMERGAQGWREEGWGCERGVVVEWVAGATTSCVLASFHPPPNLPPSRGEG